MSTYRREHEPHARRRDAGTRAARRGYDATASSTAGAAAALRRRDAWAEVAARRHGRHGGGLPVRAADLCGFRQDLADDARPEPVHRRAQWGERSTSRRRKQLKAPLAWANSTLLKGKRSQGRSAARGMAEKDLVILGSGNLIRSLDATRTSIDRFVLLDPSTRAWTRGGTCSTMTASLPRHCSSSTRTTTRPPASSSPRTSHIARREHELLRTMVTNRSRVRAFALHVATHHRGARPGHA